MSFSAGAAGAGHILAEPPCKKAKRQAQEADGPFIVPLLPDSASSRAVVDPRLAAREEEAAAEAATTVAAAKATADSVELAQGVSETQASSGPGSSCTPRFTKTQWEVHPSPYGAPYYHNPFTGESRWTLPTGPKDVVLLPGERVQREAPDGPVASQPTTVEEPSRRPHARRAAADAAVGSAAAAAQSGKTPSAPSSSSGSSDDEDERAKLAEAAALRSAAAKLEGLQKLMQERGVRPFDSYEAWMPRLAADPRFTAVPKRQRKTIFAAMAKRLGEQKQQATAAARRRSCGTFAEIVASAQQRGLLRSAATLEEALSAVAASDLGSDERWRTTTPSDRRRLLAAAWEKESAERKVEDARAVDAFRELVREKIVATMAGSEAPAWGEARRLLRDEPRFQAMNLGARRQKLYAEEVAAAAAKWLRAKRQEAEAEDELAHSRRRGSQANAEQEFRQLMEEFVKRPLEVNWQEAKVLLHDVILPDGLREVDQEMLFNLHRQEVEQRRLSAFADVLRHAPVELIGPEASFEEARSAAAKRMGGETLLKGLQEAELKDAWQVWRRVRLDEATEVFRQWLKQCAHLAGDDARVAAHGDKEALDGICKKLEGEVLWMRLSPLPTLRRRLLLERLREVIAERASSREAVQQGDFEEGG